MSRYAYRVLIGYPDGITTVTDRDVWGPLTETTAGEYIDRFAQEGEAGTKLTIERKRHGTGGGWLTHRRYVVRDRRATRAA